MGEKFAGRKGLPLRPSTRVEDEPSVHRRPQEAKSTLPVVLLQRSAGATSPLRGRSDNPLQPAPYRLITMEIIFLGTNGWYDTEVANTLCVLLKCREYDIVLDAGNGIHKLDKYIDGKKPVYLFLSHFHLDHIIGLHALLKFKFKRGLTICGGADARKVLAAFLRKPFTVPLKDLKYKTEVLEFPAQLARVPFKCSCLPLIHADPVLGYRLELDGRIIAFCTDTGYSKNSVKLARGADLLISECSYRPGESNPGWPHMNPETAAALAKEAGAARLILTHFDPSKYPSLKDRAAAQRVARRTFKSAVASRDGFTLKL